MYHNNVGDDLIEVIMNMKSFMYIALTAIGIYGISEGMTVQPQLSPESHCYKLYGMSSSNVGDIALTTYSKEKAKDLISWLLPVIDTKNSKILYVYGISGYEIYPEDENYILDIIESAKDGFWPAIDFLMSNFGVPKNFLEEQDARSILACIK